MGKVRRIAEYGKNGLIYRDMTAEEIADQAREQAAAPAMELTTEERIDELEAALVELAELVAGGEL